MGRTYHEPRTHQPSRRTLLNLVDAREGRAMLRAARSRADEDERFVPLDPDDRFDGVDLLQIFELQDYRRGK